MVGGSDTTETRTGVEVPALRELVIFTPFAYNKKYHHLQVNPPVPKDPLLSPI